MTERLRQRMRDTAAFAADVAHGFKSPLTSIRGAAELLAQGAADDPSARARFLANIELDSERLDRLVTRLLQLGRIEAATAAPERVDLRVLLEELASRSSTPDVAVQVSSNIEQAPLWGRKEDLGTAFANLYDNAVRFSPQGASALVELQALPELYRITITDSGPGVPQASEKRLFERFFTTDTEQGTGLGLAIVKSVAEAHGGRAYYRAATAGGACFVVELPQRA
jgi:two-component system sensor histidine kinase ChvG